MLFQTGEILVVPLVTLLVFTTNLQPEELLDEAYLRRIPYKITVTNPEPREFREILRRECFRQRVAFSEEALEKVVDNLYQGTQQCVRGCYARDLVRIVVDGAAFLGAPLKLDRESAARALRFFLSDGRPDESLARAGRARGPPDRPGPVGQSRRRP